MKSRLRNQFEHEMKQARDLYEIQNYAQCYFHLERAHILGQRHYIPHLRSHYWMYKVAIKLNDLRETTGQIARMIMSVGSLLGKVPLGNTGRARISPIKPMPIPEDLQAYFQ